MPDLRDRAFLLCYMSYARSSWLVHSSYLYYDRLLCAFILRDYISHASCMHSRSCAFNRYAQIVILMWCWPVISLIIEHSIDDSSYCVVCYVLRDLRELWIELAQWYLAEFYCCCSHALALRRLFDSCCMPSCNTHTSRSSSSSSIPKKKKLNIVINGIINES